VPSHNFARPRGQLVEIEIDSTALRGNRLGDPHRRSVAVYLAPGYERDPAEHFPLLVGLAAFGGSGFKLLNWQSFGESLPQRIDRLIDEGKLGPVVVALPDGFTRLGGNQWIDSPIMGRWEGFVLDELIPTLERQFRVRKGPGSRAVFGHSSGGYGALIHGLRHGDQWAAIASHSGDIGFELVYGRSLPAANAALEAHGHDVEQFLARLWAADQFRGHEFDSLMLLAMAASYAPEDAMPLGIRLPVDPETCARDPARWARWLAHDPLELVTRAESLASLRKLRGVWLDVGKRDEYFIHFGTRALVQQLEAARIDHVYEEHLGGHSGVSDRLDLSLPWLYRMIA
jgi:S-formylglutathione hydrolase FrmB